MVPLTNVDVCRPTYAPGAAGGVAAAIAAAAAAPGAQERQPDQAAAAARPPPTPHRGTPFDDPNNPYVRQVDTVRSHTTLCVPECSTSVYLYEYNTGTTSAIRV